MLGRFDALLCWHLAVGTPWNKCNHGTPHVARSIKPARVLQLWEAGLAEQGVVLLVDGATFGAGQVESRRPL
jgi:hypothetical protein